MVDRLFERSHSCERSVPCGKFASFAINRYETTRLVVSHQRMLYLIGWLRGQRQEMSDEVVLILAMLSPGGRYHPGSAAVARKLT